MSQYSLLIDTSRLRDRAGALNARGSAVVVQAVAADQVWLFYESAWQRDERADQIMGLVAGALLFVPFLIVHFALCA